MQISVKFNPEDHNLFPKQFKRFKLLLKQFMTRLKRNDIDNFSYKENVEVNKYTIHEDDPELKEEVTEEILIGTFTLDDPELNVPVDMGTPVFFSN